MSNAENPTEIAPPLSLINGGENCGLCRYSTPQPHPAPKGIMACRRHPPTLFLMKQRVQQPVMRGGVVDIAAMKGQQPQTVEFPASEYPPVQAIGWCGEFQAKDRSN